MTSQSLKILIGSALSVAFMLTNTPVSDAATIKSQSKQDMKIFVYEGCKDDLHTTAQAAQQDATDASEDDPIISKLIGITRDFGNKQLLRIQDALKNNYGCKLVAAPIGGVKTNPINRRGIGDINNIPKDTIILAYKTGLFQSAKPAICSMTNGDVYVYTKKLKKKNSGTGSTKIANTFSGDFGLKCSTDPSPYSVGDEDNGTK